MRLAAASLGAWLCLCAATVAAQTITSASYDEPTDRYGHDVLGGGNEWGNMVVEVRREKGTKGGLFHGHVTLTYHLRLPQELVYEDIAPRLIDLDGDGGPEIVVVESHRELGARLAVYGLSEDGIGLRAWSNFIGQRNRWLAPVGAADFNGDGVMDIGLVDRPHLARRLIVLSYGEGLMPSLGGLQPVTNHRIGEDYISGGVRDCAGAPEMIVANQDWSSIVAVRWNGTGFAGEVIAPFTGRSSMEAALKCD